mmetsp:Transcript_17124/g.57837  ORF Transcript_17124/g.57837 Transcript_17124/m.57837 type:complete len:256 (-) Transcript_17124:302-1069(-)
MPSRKGQRQGRSARFDYGADARAGGTDLRRGEQVRRLCQVQSRGRLRRRRKGRSDLRAAPRLRAYCRHAGPHLRRLGRRRLRLLRRRGQNLHACPRRGGPHVGHGLRAAAAQDRFPNPAGPADFDVVRDVAQGGAADGQRLSQGLLPGQRRVFRTLREQGHYAARRGRRRLRQVQAHDCVLKGARRGKDDRLRGDEARVRPAHAVSADGRLSCQVHPRRQGPGRARLGPQRVPRGQVPAPRRHGRGRARLGHQGH